MRVVADASPLHYLILLEYPQIIQTLFGSVVVPSTVVAELPHPHTPMVVRTWMAHTLSWVDIRAVDVPLDATLTHLDPGERDAILLAQSIPADLLWTFF